MLVIYDTEDCNLSSDPQNAPAFLKRTILLMTYIRTDSFEKTIMQNWVRKKDGVKIQNNKNWVYNHYVPHSRIQKAIENFITQNHMTREIAIEWLINVTSKLKITPDEELAKCYWGDSRIAYDVWADWAVSAICDWKENIFYGPGTGDQRGTALDNPTDLQQLKRVQKAAKTLDKLIPAEPSLLVDKISTEPLSDDEEADPLELNAQEAKEVLRQYFGTDREAEEDAGDESWDEDESGSEELFPLEEKEWKRGVQLRVIKKIDFKKSSGMSPYQKLKAAKAEKKKNLTNLKGQKLNFDNVERD